MFARITLKRALVAFLCLAAAAGCARVANEADVTATTKEPAGPEPALAAETPLASAVPSADPAPPAAIESNAVPGGDAAPERPSTAEAELPLPAAINTAPPPPLDPPAVAPAQPSSEPARAPDLAASELSPPAAVETLDLASLGTRLRKTKAISLRTKLGVKKECDELLERFRAYHAEHGTATLTELRRSYDSLFRKLYSLLEEADPPLARDIDRSRAEIWAILADPIRFGASAASHSTRGTPQA